ncbi:hypothetical protein C5167_041364 [Papaver somniferum]|nr:hypothetical protein C5167_041364 [Papaver somniferum]
MVWFRSSRFEIDDELKSKNMIEIPNKKKTRIEFLHDNLYFKRYSQYFDGIILSGVHPSITNMIFILKFMVCHINSGHWNSYIL